MDNRIPIFKPWVPEWLVKVILFFVLLPSTALFFIPLSNMNAAAGHYGCEPADIQFSVVLFYAGYVGFYSLERRFSLYLATKEYFLVFTLLQVVTTFICYTTQSLNVLFPVRFFQGLLFCSTVNLSLSVIFSRLHTERAREIGFSVFFCMLLCAIPFNNLATAELIDSYNFNIVYKLAMYAYVPGLVLLLLAMNNIRLNVRFPLEKLDWQSFGLYSLILCLFGYIMIFGQEYYWMDDLRIRYSVIAIITLAVIFTIRQRRMKRPYLNISIFRHRNYNVGLLLLFIMYICRFASGLTNSYFATVLNFDPIHVSYMNVLNLFGIVAGVIISCCLVLQKKKIRYTWIFGFLCLLIFHVVMFFLFDIQADPHNYFIPLVLQGLGVGMIMVPTIIFSISSVNVLLGPSASGACLAIRYLGFCASIAIINFFQLYHSSRHHNAFQDQITWSRPVVEETLQKHSDHLLGRGLYSSISAKASARMLTIAVNKQSHLRFVMDYYEMMSWILLATIIVVSLFPYLNRTVLYLKSRYLVPA